jgi:signal transduction histidine kinase
VDRGSQVKLLATWRKFLAGNEKELKITWRWLNGKTALGIYIRLDLVMPGMSGLIGCITDMSHEEERVHLAEQKRMEAEESKRQQELLIDLTSHEIRTPVSAILQCSSLVKENLVALIEQLKLTTISKAGFVPTEALLRDLEEDVEALESE